MFIRSGRPFDINIHQVIGENQYPLGYFYDEQRRLDNMIFEVHPTDSPAITATQKLVLTGYSQDAQWRWIANYTVADQTDDELAASAAALAALKVHLTEAIDAHFAAIYDRWLRFEAAYVAREAAAVAFKAANYVGDPGQWVSAFAAAAGKTNSQATDLILTQATSLRAALLALDSIRMTKYGIFAAQTQVTAQAEYDTIIAAGNAIAASLQ